MQEDSSHTRKHFGRLYCNKLMSIIVECTICNEEFGVYDRFLDHFFELHFDSAGPSEELDMKDVKTGDQKLYANIYITNGYCINIDCLLCSGEYKNFRPFLDHVFENHNDVTESKSISLKHSIKNGFADNNDDGSNIEFLNIETVIDSADFLITEDDVEELEEYQEASSGQTDYFVLNSKPNRKRKEYKDDGNVRKYKCKICGFAFKEQFNLRGHELRHTTKRPFTCIQCKKAFFTRTELETHERRHRGERPFVCTYCGDGFFTVSSMRHHERRHRNERPFKCEHCDKSFYEGRFLRDHSVVHTQERNWACDVCSLTFSRKKTLKTHMKLHNNALQYACSLCESRFNQKPTLLWHIKTKHDVILSTPLLPSSSEEITCTRCNLNFSDKDALLDHQSNVHAEVDTMATLEALEEVESETLVEYLD